MELRIKYSLYALVAGDVIFIWIAYVIKYRMWALAVAGSGTPVRRNWP